MALIFSFWCKIPWQKMTITGFEKLSKSISRKKSDKWKNSENFHTVYSLLTVYDIFFPSNTISRPSFIKKDMVADLQGAFINLAKSVEEDPPPQLEKSDVSKSFSY